MRRTASLSSSWLLTMLAGLCIFSALLAEEEYQRPVVPLDFDYLLVATAADPELDMWRHTLRGTALVIPDSPYVYREQPFRLVAIFQGYGVNEEHEAKVTYDFTITGPEGKVVLEDKDLDGVDGIITEPDALMLARQQVELVFEESDLFGEYEISVTARDHISGKLRKRQVRIKLVPFGYASHLDTMEEFRRWFPTYYLQPDPVKAFHAYLDYAEIENQVTGQLDFSQISFFQTLFQEHPFLLKALADSYPDSDLETRLRVLFMLALLDYREAPYLADLPELEKTYFENVRLFYPPDPYEELISPQQLDSLWAEFYATGSYKPIKQIVEGLSLAEYEGSLVEYGKGDESDKSEEERMDAYREVLLQSVRWSLLSNCRQHPLVRSYCGYLFQEGDLPESVRAELGAMLATADSAPSRVGLRRGVPEQAIPNPFRTTR